jgi:L-malate glycosyltransferase
MSRDGRTSICHVMTADLWAGAEVQVATAASCLVRHPDIELSAVLFNDGWLASRLRNLGVDVAVIDEARHNSVEILRFTARFLKDRRVDLVHTHRFKDNVLGTIAAKLAGVPCVVRTVHGLPEPMTGWNRMKCFVYELIDKVVLWLFADQVIAVSSRMADVLKRSGYRRSTMMHLHNGVDLARVRVEADVDAVRQSLGIANDDVVIVTAGRLCPVKGHVFLIRAARLILANEPRARFLIVGSGPLKSDLLALAKTLGVDHRCAFIEPAGADSESLYAVLAASDIFVLPSLSEGIPMALLEAMALARPSVATAVGGVPEVIEDRVNGLLVPARDDHALAEACLELAHDRAFARALAARAQDDANRRFSSERNGQRLLNVYETVTCRRRTALSISTLLMAPLWKASAFVRRRLERALERRRVDAARRDPSAIVAALATARNVLVVCHGNIIRSPFAARLIAQAVGKEIPVVVRSAGLEAVPGRGSHPFAIRTAQPLRVDLTKHAAARVTAESAAAADVIFVMDVDQLCVMRSRFPEAQAKTFLLTCLDPGGPLEIRDPVNGDESVFHSCYEHITRVVQPIVHTLGRAVS